MVLTLWVWSVAASARIVILDRPLPLGVWNAFQGFGGMRSFTGFFSIIALGLITGAVFTTSVSHSLSQFWGESGQVGGIKVDYVSLLLGIVIGALISNLAGMEWSRIPRRVAAWLVDNADNFGYAMVALVLGCVVIYY